MSIFNMYPYQDFHEMNLDWLLKIVKALDEEIDVFTALNKITFEGEWDITKNYPAWCIVNTNGGQQGYISIKPVPPGVVISNTDYWQSIVDYSSVIGDLQNRVIALENELPNINNTAKRQIVYIGDSFLYGGSIPGVTLDAALNPLLGFEYTAYKFCKGGTGFVRTDSDGNNDFPDQVRRAVTTITDPDDRLKVTDFIIAGGINDSDATTYADFKTAVDSIVNQIETNFKNAKIWFIPMLWNIYPFTMQNMTRYNNLYQACRDSGKSTMADAYTFLMDLDAATYMQDTVHPSMTGYELMAGYIANFIMDNTINDYRYKIGNNLMSTQNEPILYTYEEKNGFKFIKLTLVLGQSYAADTSIAQLPDTYAGGIIPLTKVVKAGTFSGDLYINGDGTLKANAVVSNVQIYATAIIPSGFIF